MALSAGESFSGGQVRDSKSRSVVISEITNAVLSAGEFYSAGFLCDPDSRTVICQDTAHSALAAGETLTGGDVRDKVGRIACAVETLNAPVSAGSQFSDGWLNDSQGRRIIALDTLGAALVAGEQFTSGQIRDSVGRLVLAAESVVAPFDPSTIAGLIGWWKADALALADGTAVSSWTASAGPALVQATGANQPIFKTAIQNGKPVLRFNGTSHVLAAGSAIVSPLHFFAVARNTGATFSGFNGLLTHNTTASNDIAFIGNGGTTTWYNGGWTPTSPPYYINGVLDATFQGPMNVFAYMDVQTVGLAAFIPQVGLDRNNAGRYWNGDIAELLAYNSALGTTDRTNVENYLKAKYGL